MDLIGSARGQLRDKFPSKRRCKIRHHKQNIKTSNKIIKNFEVCARVLVTTQDISILDVIPKNNVKVIPIEGGFTPEESLKVHLN